MTINLSRTRSNRKQRCRVCSCEIPAREESIKTIKTIRGSHSITESWYTCLNCDMAGAAKEAAKSEHAD